MSPAAISPLDGKLTESWLHAKIDGFSQADFLATSFPNGDYGMTIEKAGAYPVSLRLTRPSVSALKLYGTLLQLSTLSAPTNESFNEAVWLPAANIGPVLVIAHYHPGAPIPFPTELVQPIIVSVEEYRELVETVRGQCDFLRDYMGTPTEAVLTPWATAKGLEISPERAALKWVEALGLIQSYDLGMVKSARATPPNAALPISPDYSLGLLRITKGVRIGRFDIGKMMRAQVEGITPALCERNKIHFFWTDGKSATFTYCLDPKSDALDDFLAGRIRHRVGRIAVSRESLALFAQGDVAFGKVEAGHIDSQAGDNPEKGATVIDPRAVEKFDPRVNDDNNQTVHWILVEAARRGASDIHIECQGSAMWVRAAKDSTGIQLLGLPKPRLQGVSAVLKTLSGIDLDGTNHDEGRFTFGIGSRFIDVRVSLLITAEGPKWTLRFFDKSIGIRSLAQLGLSETDMQTIRQATRKRHGIILVSGPTGHGKSTTLNACLGELISPERFIYTLEDPIEFKIDGVCQLVATSNAKRIAAGEMSFADGIKRLLRADPDVILVAEIRDQATVESAIEASMTGHLVLSTVHANDCVSLVHRMVDLNADPMLLSETLVLAASQRLVRKLCACQSFAPITEAERSVFECHKVAPPRYIHSKSACQQCDYTGYKGRAALLEFLPVTNEIRTLIGAKKSSAEIRDAAKAAGYRSLLMKGLELVASGITSLEEVQSVCPSE